jgi:hypothetical protein
MTNGLVGHLESPGCRLYVEVVVKHLARLLAQPTPVIGRFHQEL